MPIIFDRYVIEYIVAVIGLVSSACLYPGDEPPRVESSLRVWKVGGSNPRSDQVKDLKKYRDTKQSKKGTFQNSKDKSITWNKETQMTGQHEPLWKTSGEIRCSGRVSISCTACGTRHNIPYVVSRNETYSWQQYHCLQISLAMVVTETR